MTRTRSSLEEHFECDHNSEQQNHRIYDDGLLYVQDNRMMSKPHQGRAQNRTQSPSLCPALCTV